jgi:hypothetical protein
MGRSFGLMRLDVFLCTGDILPNLRGKTIFRPYAGAGKEPLRDFVGAGKAASPG